MTAARIVAILPALLLYALLAVVAGVGVSVFTETVSGLLQAF